MKEKLQALNELAKTMSQLKADKFKSRKGKPAEEVCEDEDCEDESHDHKPEVDIEVVELEDGEEMPEDDDKPKSFSEILADVAKSKSKKH